jgi:shikimate 5-dehydrogenase
MAQVWINILDKFNLKHKQYSRKIHGEIESLDFSNIDNAVVLNCCSRSFVFKGKLSNRSLFWNMNYNSPEQEILIKSLGCPYRDGSQLLKKQAIHASKLFL